MRLVIVESPYAARNPDGSWDEEGVETNIRYLRMAMRDCLLRDEAPYASHALYTQPGVLDDQVPEERKLGMAAGFSWNQKAYASVVYVDRGLSLGMRQGIQNAAEAGRPIEVRHLPLWWLEEAKRDPSKAKEKISAMYEGMPGILDEISGICPGWRAT